MTPSEFFIVGMEDWCGVDWMFSGTFSEDGQAEYVLFDYQLRSIVGFTEFEEAKKMADYLAVRMKQAAEANQRKWERKFWVKPLSILMDPKIPQMPIAKECLPELVRCKMCDSPGEFIERHNPARAGTWAVTCPMCWAQTGVYETKSQAANRWFSLNQGGFALPMGEQ